MKVSELQANEYGSYYANYISKVGESPLVEELKKSTHNILALLADIPQEKFDFKYAEGKWTIKELLQHIIDAERVFSYRALRFARKDNTDLPGFEQDDYVENSNVASRSGVSLVSEYHSVRQATISLFESFPDEALLQIGTASGNPMSVRALGFVIIGHEMHHANIIKERYL